MRLLVLLALYALGLSACGGLTGEPLLPPLARVEVPAIEPREIPAPKPAPASLAGKADSEVLLFLGPPDLARREDPALLWRYGDERCGIHLFLYEEDSVFRVTHVETRLDGTGPRSPADCLDSLRRRPEAPAQ